MLLFFSQSATGTEEPGITEPIINGEFVRQNLLEMDAETWEAFSNGQVPVSEHQESVNRMIHRLRRVVPYSFLTENIFYPNVPSQTKTPKTLAEIANDSAAFRGRVFQVHYAAVKEIQVLPLTPEEQETYQLPEFYRCRIKLVVSSQTWPPDPGDGKIRNYTVLPIYGEADVYVPTVPSVWLTQPQLNENIAFTGIFIKKIENKPSDIPVFVAPRIEWYPGTFFGRHGLDVGSFDQVPVLSVADLKQPKFDSLPRQLSLLSRQEIIQRAFRFTAADREPFYGLLRLAATAKVGEWPEKQNDSSPVADLFLKPKEQFGKPFSFYGKARRVVKVPVDDAEVQKRYGIDHYYQIFFFTSDSQRHPLVTCVPSLPDGMPLGDGADYTENIALSGFFYKLWIYETSERVKDDDNLDEASVYKKGVAPLLIANTPTWFPQDKSVEQSREFMPISVTIFAVLAIVWVALRRRASTRAVREMIDK